MGAFVEVKPPSGATPVLGFLLALGSLLPRHSPTPASKVPSPDYDFQRDYDLRCPNRVDRSPGKKDNEVSE
eukprot:3580731-Amphidinium_carterae.1